jgi:hypothetical protein
VIGIILAGLLAINILLIRWTEKLEKRIEKLEQGNGTVAAPRSGERKGEQK